MSTPPAVQDVYTFPNVTFELNDRRLAVDKLVFTALDNSPPTITVTTASINYKDDVARGLKIVDLAWIMAKGSKADQLTATLKTKVYLYVEVQVNGSLFTNVLCKEWVLMPSGLDPVYVGNAVVLTFVIAHPVVMADTSTLTLWNIPMKIEPQQVLGSNPYECYMDALGKFAEKLKLMGTPEPGTEPDSSPSADVKPSELWDMNKSLVVSVTKAINALKKHTEGDGYIGMPYEKWGWLNADRVKGAIWDYVSNTFNSTPYEAFLGFLGDFMLIARSADPFSDAPLAIEPFNPWADNYRVDVYDTDIEYISIPSADRGIVGVVVTAGLGATKEFGYCPPGAYGQPGVGDQPGVPTGTYAYGWHLRYTDVLLGKIAAVQLPHWMFRVAGLITNGVDDLHTEENLNNPENTETAGDEAAAADMLKNEAGFAGMIRAYAEDVLYNQLFVGRNVTITVKLMKFVWIYPGHVAAIKSRIDDKELRYFYVNRVEHTIDVNGQKAYTNITGTHFREANAEYAGISPEDTLTSGTRLETNMYES